MIARHRIVLGLFAWSAAVALGQPAAKPADNAAARTAPRPVLPGLQPTGMVLLPNQWSIKPVGKQYSLGDFPVHAEFHPSGQWLAVLHAGFGEHEIIIFDAAVGKVVSRVTIDQTFHGLCFAPDGATLYASGGEYERVHAFAFADGYLSRPRVLPIADPKEKFVVSGVVASPDGKELYVAGVLAHVLARVPLAEPNKLSRIALPAESHPYTALPTPDGKRLFVSLWGASAVAVIDLSLNKPIATWATASHPTEMALSPDGQTLYVACSNSTQVSVLDAASGAPLQTVVCALYPKAPSGNTPSSLALTPDGQLLFVANADANNVTVLNVADRKRALPLGFIPAGWHPTCVRYHAKRKQVFITNGKGASGKANPQGPRPDVAGDRTLIDYIGALYRGTLSVVDAPSPAELKEYSRLAYRCSPLRADTGVSATPPKGHPIPAKVGDSSPIKHVIYIVKENRTYDQVFGDMPEGNGAPQLCLFPEKVTPNHHRLARQFVLLDNFYVDGEVSADGHEWSMGAYANDYIERTWPLLYRGGRGKFSYPSEGSGGGITQPAGGYIWDRCKEAGVSYYSFGEWVANGPTPNDPGTARAKALEGHFDPMFRSYDLDYPDVERAKRFLTKYREFEAADAMPRFIVLRLPNDHTYGASVGKLTPTAMVADNDLALGMVVEGVSKGKHWPTTAIFVVEDDAQNGPDHVDAHRTVALAISPYCKRGVVDSSMYSTTSMLRTMELILGLKPMSQFDAAARPMIGSFDAKLDATPYQHVVPDVDRNARNTRAGWSAEVSAKLDFSKEDAADDIVFNEVIWRAVRGEQSRMPAPVRAAFFAPHVED